MCNLVDNLATLTELSVKTYLVRTAMVDLVYGYFISSISAQIAEYSEFYDLPTV